MALELDAHHGTTYQMLEDGPEQTDPWCDWLLHRRHADDPAYETVVEEVVGRFADRVLDAAQLCRDMTLLDVGAGSGLLGFRAIERLGAAIRVVFTDISAPLLRHVQSSAAHRGVTAQCTFIQCSAENLTGVADA